ncbi:MAG: DUF202 domain-containing protein [Dehalococcoidia bacterium]
MATAESPPPLRADPEAVRAARANPNLLRDRLANERTFLAWLRTGIAITSLGFVVARFDIFLNEIALAGGRDSNSAGATITLGLILVLAGPAVITLAAVRFFSTDRALLRGSLDSRRLVRTVVAVVTVGAIVAGVALMAHLLSLWPS